MSACSLLVNTSADQCATDRDCASFAASGAHVCRAGLCVREEAAQDAATTDAGDGSTLPTSCQTSATCGQNAVCDPSTHACTSLVTAECGDVVGPYQDENAVLFGAIFPTSISQPPDWAKDVPSTGAAMRNALALATADFASDQSPYGGLPPRSGSGKGRPIAFVVCSDAHSTAATANATKHLAVDLKVPAIVGSAFSAYTHAIVDALSAQGKSDVLLLTPRSTDLPDSPLVWRLAEPDDAQGGALSALLASREATLKGQLGDAGATTLRVAVVYKEDAYGSAVAAAVRGTIKFNGTDATGNGGNYREFKYGNPDSPTYTPEFAPTVAGLVAFKPHVIVAVGTNEIASAILPATESGWTEPTFRPQYLLSDGALVPELWHWLASSDPTDSTRKRILGTTAANAGALFSSYASAFSGKFPQSSAIVQGAAGAYDAVYLLAYGAASAGSEALTGTSIAQGFTRLLPGGGALKLGVGAANIATAFARLTAGQPIDLEGVSSPLDFDPAQHAIAAGATQVWCVPNPGGGAKEAILSGETIDPSGQVQGTLSSACGF